MPSPPNVPPAARDAILAWYGERGRPLAFRRTRDPYAVLVSELMAQQTQAARAAEHWERFMARFPTVQALAAATPADVLRAWRGLGYDRRGLAIWRAAGLIVERHDGHVPSSIEALEALPGVGPYTARAVAAIAFGVRVGAVDVNVRRVIGRLVAGSPDELTNREVQTVADAAVPSARPADWTHAVMDLGATVCRARSADCPSCPARAWCRAVSTQASARSRRANPTTARTATAGRRAASVPFPATTRWLRGRIMDRLRDASDGTWVELDDAIGGHGSADVAATLTRMARDGVIELGPTDDGRLRARLPLA